MRKILTLVGTCALVASLGLVGSLSAAPGNKYAETTRIDDCGDGEGTDLDVSITGPEKLWPPNHKYVPVSVTVVDNDGGDVALETEGTHDQYLEDGSEMNGAGNTADDVNPATDAAMGTDTATTNHEVRAERSGREQAGRTYTFMFEAESSDEDPCVGSFDIFVPHDMRGGADWK